MLDAGVIATPPHTPLPDRLLDMYESLHEIIKTTLLKELHMDYPPLSVFGLEALKNILQEGGKEVITS